MRQVASNTLPTTTHERLLDATSLIQNVPALWRDKNWMRLVASNGLISCQTKYPAIVFDAVIDATCRIQKAS